MSLVASVFCAVVWVSSVTSQLIRQPGSDNFPKGFGSSFPLPPPRPQFDLPSAFLSGQSFRPLTTGDTQRPFRPPQQRPLRSFTATTTNNNNNNKASGGQKNHTYPDGSMGGDYPTHLAAKQAGNKPSGQHTYPDGTTGDDYPTKMAAKQAQGQGGVPGGQSTNFQNTAFTNNPSSKKTHTYPDGTTGEDYLTKMKAQQAQQQQQNPFGRAQLFNSQGAAVTGSKSVGSSTDPGQAPHTYPDGATGHDYPTKKAQQQQQQQQQQQPAGQFRNFPIQFQVPSGTQNNPHQAVHTYADGTTGGDYPTKMAQQQRQQQQQPPVQIGQSFPAQFQVPLAPGGVKKTPNPVAHTYADGTTGGDYPSVMKQQQQQKLSSRVQFGTGFPAQFQAPPVRDSSEKNPNQVEHTYADGTKGGDYPTRMAEQQRQQQQQQRQQQQQQQQGKGTGFGSQGSLPGRQQGNSAFLVGTVPQQFTVPVSSNKASALPTQQFVPPQVFVGTFRGQQQQQQSFVPPSPTPRQVKSAGSFFKAGTQPVRSQLSQGPQTGPVPHTYPDGTTGGNYPDHKAKQAQASNPQVPQTGSIPGRHTYPDGTTGGNYPDHKAKQAAAAAGSANIPPTFTGGAFHTGNTFMPSSQRAPFGAQCFRRQDLAASYKLSDSDSGYPEDDILSELRSNQHLVPMVGYGSLPASKDSSRFVNFGESFSLPSSFPSFGFSDNKQTNKVSNAKLFPAGFDANTLGTAMKPLDSACPAQFSPLKTLTIDNKRCFVVNSQFQDISFAKCSRQNCNQCGGGSGGVSVCVEQYSWLTVMVYCAHWQRGQRVNAVRVYLPRGCSCNCYLC